MKRSMCAFLCAAAVLSLAPPLRAGEKQKSPQVPFPFDIIEGAAQAAGSLAEIPFQALSAYKPAGAGTKGWDPHWRYARYGYKTFIQREYLQLNWYDDIRRGYSELHEWKEADEELYQMFRKR